ncbi:unnamed protein product [Linum trigynum]
MSVRPHGVLLNEHTLLPEGQLAVPRRGRGCGRGNYTWVHPRNVGGTGRARARGNRDERSSSVDPDPWHYQAVYAFNSGESADDLSKGTTHRPTTGPALPPLRISEISSGSGVAQHDHSAALGGDQGKGKGKAIITELDSDEDEDSLVPPSFRTGPSFRMALTDEELEVEWRKRSFSEMMESRDPVHPTVLPLLEAPPEGQELVTMETDEPASKRPHVGEEAATDLGTVEEASSEWPQGAK